MRAARPVTAIACALAALCVSAPAAGAAVSAHGSVGQAYMLGASSHLRLATEAELERDFPMFDVGAMPPLGPMMPMPEVIDVHLLYHESVLCAGGDHRHSLRLDPRDLLRVCEPRVAAICETPEGRSRFRDLPRI